MTALELTVPFASVFRFVGWSILGLTLVMWVFAEPLVSVMFPEVADAARLVALTRLVLPAQVFLVTGALLMAVQYTHRRFFIPALAPLIYNLGIIGGGLIAAAMGNASPEGFLWGAVIGSAVGNFGLQWYGARTTGTRLVRVPAGQSSVKPYLLLAFPLMLGQSIAVLDEQFVRFFGQLEEGATSALSLARQLNMVPVGVIAQAAGVAAFPFLARLAARGQNDELVAATGRAARNTVFVATGATAALVVLARPMVRLLYQHGEFSSTDAELVASLLVIYAFSIPAWGLHQILARHFYAKRRMWATRGDRNSGNGGRRTPLARPLFDDGRTGPCPCLHSGDFRLLTGSAGRLGYRLRVVSSARDSAFAGPRVSRWRSGCGGGASADQGSFRER